MPLSYLDIVHVPRLTQVVFGIKESGTGCSVGTRPDPFVSVKGSEATKESPQT